MLPWNTGKDFLSYLRQIFLILWQRLFPGPVKAAAAKLSGLFLCKLLNRFRFSPQIVISLPESPQNARHPPPSHFSGGCLIQQIICICVCIYRVMPSGLPSSLRGGRSPALRWQRSRRWGMPLRCCKWWRPLRSCCSAGRPDIREPE